jgi:hypothetical protein
MSLPCRQGAVEGKVRIRTANKNFFRLRNRQKLVRIRFGRGLDSRIYGSSFLGAHGGVVVKALRYKQAGHSFDSQWCYWNFSVT